MSMSNGLRQAEHQAFLVSKKVRRARAAAALRDADHRRAPREKRRPFTYSKGKLLTPSCTGPDPEGVQQEGLPGYRATPSANVPELPRFLGGCLRGHCQAVIGTSAFACRLRPLFTAEWVREFQAQLDFLQEPLREVRTSDCDPHAALAGYLIRWTEILGDITQPLSFKHQFHLRFSDRLRPQLEEYR